MGGIEVTLGKSRLHMFAKLVVCLVPSVAAHIVYYAVRLLALVFCAPLAWLTAQLSFVGIFVAAVLIVPAVNVAVTIGVFFVLIAATRDQIYIHGLTNDRSFREMSSDMRRVLMDCRLWLACLSQFTSQIQASQVLWLQVESSFGKSLWGWPWVNPSSWLRGIEFPATAVCACYALCPVAFTLDGGCIKVQDRSLKRHIQTPPAHGEAILVWRDATPYACYNVHTTAGLDCMSALFANSLACRRPARGQSITA